MQSTFRFARPPPNASPPWAPKLQLQIQEPGIHARFLPILEVWRVPVSLKFNWVRNGLPYLEWTGNFHVHARNEKFAQSNISAAVREYEERESAVAAWDQYQNLKSPQSNSCSLIVLNPPLGQVPLATIECKSAGRSSWHFRLRDIEELQFRWERRQSSAHETFVLQYIRSEAEAGAAIATISNGYLDFPAGIEGIMKSVQSNQKTDGVEKIIEEPWIYTYICLMTAWTIQQEGWSAML
ncbi:hypothetical protein N7513_003254 [Penicillium frequentans]|uniref:Uncharacterized protein n=1 Tax=Penicillium frequentans TaxID=3151616 RepID=A0AAD6CHE5_9EURO|nr:hypothetical protein N7494_013194 [Penicillium glabrum]KAJ5557668.1 hypothetical protein N7513_003254 [Penicillium glabrum]